MQTNIISDSLQFLSHPLSVLIDDLKQRDCKFDILKQSVISKTDGKLDEEKFSMNKIGKGISTHMN